MSVVGITLGIWNFRKYSTGLRFTSDEAAAVLAEPGPWSKSVAAEITVRAVILLTPRLIRIG